MTNLIAPLRTLLVVATAAAIVVGAAHADLSADFGRAADQGTGTDRASASLQSVHVCAGPDRPGAPGFEQATQRVTVATAFAPEDLIEGGGEGRFTIGSAPAGSASTTTTTRTPSVTPMAAAASPVLTGVGRSALGVAVTQSAVDTDKAAAGLALAVCRAPVHEAWIPLGGNQVGRLDRVVLTNPSGSAITVDAVVVGHRGPVAGKGGTDVVVGPHDRTVISVGDFNDDLSDAMLHVTTSGGPVAVTVADVFMAGERRAGESLAGPTAAAAKDQMIPAFVVAAGPAKVRVAVPGRDDATVRVQAVDTSGNVVADEVQEVTAGTTAGVPLTGAGRGTYAVRVTADVPIVAAGLAITGTTGTTDLAWAASTDPVSRLGGLALPTLPAGTKATLMLAPSDRTQQVEVVTGAHRRQVTVPADRPVLLEVTGSPALWISSRSGGPVHAAVAFSGRSADADLLEVLPVQPVVSAATVRDVTAGVD